MTFLFFLCIKKQQHKGLWVALKEKLLACLNWIERYPLGNMNVPGTQQISFDTYKRFTQTCIDKIVMHVRWGYHRPEWYICSSQHVNAVSQGRHHL